MTLCRVVLVDAGVDASVIFKKILADNELDFRTKFFSTNTLQKLVESRKVNCPE